MRLRAAEQMKSTSRERHETSMKDFIAAEESVQQLEKQLKRAIRKSRPYFQESEKFKQHLLRIKQQIDIITERIRSSKRCYSVTLKELERISEEIHEKRNTRLVTSLSTDVHAANEKSSPDDDCSADMFSYDCLVPELDVTSARFQLQVRPATRAFVSPETSCSSSSSSSGPGPVDESVFAHLSQLCLNGFEEVGLD